MKSFLITLICFYVCCAGGSEAKSSVYEEFSQLRDAAYDGDLDYIQQRFKVIKSERTEAEKGQLRSSLIVEDALAGNQIEIVEWCIENDKNLEKLSGLFSTKLVDEKYAAIILRKIPELKKYNGGIILANALLSENVPVVKFFLKSGLKPTTMSSDRSLHTAIYLRNLELISLLLDNGANPYVTSVGRFSAAKWALELRSSILLKALDRESKYSSQLAELERVYPTATNSPFVGLWGNESEPFGSFSIQINADRSGIFNSLLPIPFVWHDMGQKIEVLLLSGNTEDGLHIVRSNALEMRIAGKNLVFGSTNDVSQKEQVAARIETAQQPTRNTSRPHYLRIEEIRISGSTNLLIQINNHFVSVPIAKLIAPSKESASNRRLNNNSLVRWSEFRRGQIQASDFTNSIKVPFIPKKVSPGYSTDGTKVGFDHGHLASTEPGHDYTLYPSMTIERYRGKDAGPYGDNVEPFVLLSKKPFSHGNNWLMFYILKAKGPP